jgi:hypothetical protein
MRKEPFGCRHFREGPQARLSEVGPSRLQGGQHGRLEAIKACALLEGVLIALEGLGRTWDAACMGVGLAVHSKGACASSRLLLASAPGTRDKETIGSIERKALETHQSEHSAERASMDPEHRGRGCG